MTGSQEMQNTCIICLRKRHLGLSLLVSDPTKLNCVFSHLVSNLLCIVFLLTFMAWPEVFGKETDNVQRLKVLLRMSQCLFIYQS